MTQKIDPQEPTKAKWQLAKEEHFTGFEIAPFIKGETSCKPSVYGDRFNNAAKEIPEDKGHKHLLTMLSAIMWMGSSADNPQQPFHPMFRSSEARSAAPEDFAGPHVDIIEKCFYMCENPVVKARLGHLVWYLERKRHELGRAALEEYIKVIRQLDDGTLICPHDDTAFSITGHKILSQALQVSRGLGRPEPLHGELLGIIADLRKRPTESDHDVLLLKFTETDLDWSASPAEEVGHFVENFLSAHGSEVAATIAVDLWRLAARAYKGAGDHDKAHACKTNAAECLASEAETFAAKDGAAMIAAHWMSQAIAEYHGLPASRERRKELRHRLIDIQDGIKDEMQPFEYSMDIKETAESVRETFEGKDLSTAFKTFALLGFPPDPDKLVADAQKQASEFPLSSMFDTAFLDADGKTIAKSDATWFGDEHSAADLEGKIAQAEGIRRNYFAKAVIEVARSSIALKHFISDQEIGYVLLQSPAVPPHLLHTMSVGFTNFFRGEYVSAMYILTPMVEGILRHVLRTQGHDVSTFDDATGTQEDRTISALYDSLSDELNAIFGTALIDDVRRVFLSKHGPNVRNGVAHALHHDGVAYGPDAIYACWLIWHICCLPLAKHWNEIFPSS